MAQVDKFEIEPNLSGLSFRLKANEKFLALCSSNSGTTEPKNPSEGMLWFDISNAQKQYLKVRDKQNRWNELCEIDLATGIIKSKLDLDALNKILDNRETALSANLSAQINTKINLSEKAAPNGVATLDDSGKISPSQLPPNIITGNTKTDFPYQGKENAIYIETSTNKIYRYLNGAYILIGGAVTSINGSVGDVKITKESLGIIDDQFKKVAKADTADRITTPRTITIHKTDYQDEGQYGSGKSSGGKRKAKWHWGGSAVFDGTKDISISVSCGCTGCSGGCIGNCIGNCDSCRGH